METFDIEAVKANLTEMKREYEQAVVMYQELKMNAHPKQHFPEIEKNIFEFQETIKHRELMIAEYEDLQNTMKMLDDGQADIMDQLRKVHAIIN